MSGCALVIAACVAACFGAIAETPPLICGDGQQAFNGACHDICKPSRPTCAKPADRCAAIDAETFVCVDAASLECAYLGDDTKCGAQGGRYASGFRSGRVWQSYSGYPSGYPVDPSTLTDYEDPGFTLDVLAAEGVTGLGDSSTVCQGNAVWIATPAVGTVACHEQHQVHRCQLVTDSTYGSGGTCRPMLGTTVETVAPSR